MKKYSANEECELQPASGWKQSTPLTGVMLEPHAIDVLPFCDIVLEFHVSFTELLQ